MSAPQKSTLFIDTNDEITTIIAKLQDAEHDIVALVLPKRTNVFQSLVNTKLLKRAADAAGKKAVLVTSDETILPLAGLVGMYVAATPQSKPYLPASPDNTSDDGIDPKTPIGELAVAASALDDDTIDLAEMSALDVPGESEPVGKSKPSKKTKVPNFNSFRKRLIIGVVALVLLIVVGVFARVVLPRAEIVLETTAQNYDQTIEFTAEAGQDSVDIDRLIAPATAQETTEEREARVTTTGERNTGDQASGTMTLTNCINDGESKTVPSGTAFSSGNFTFISTAAVELDPAIFSGANCRSNEFGLSEDVPVRAENPGENHNLSARSYTSAINGILAFGSQMSGGTDQIVQVVSARDIATARQQLETELSQGVQEALAEDLRQAGLVPLPDTMTRGDIGATATPQENQEADEVTVRASATFRMLGVSNSDVRQLLEDSLQDEVDLDRQAILDDGLSSASVRVIEGEGDSVRVRVRTIVAVGPDVDVDGLKEEIAGQKRSLTESALLAVPGVRDVQIDYSPFWVFSTPRNTSKIDMTVQLQGDPIDAADPDDVTDDEQAGE
jgi:hypothetical protein